MKFKLLSVHSEGVNNIGDYIQALASAQYLPVIDGFVNREELKQYEDDECKLFMNGWYMHNPQNWPPSKKIHPLFVSFHLNTSVANKMLSEKGFNYLKQHSPIGCRDTNTVRLLTENGIDAYFSGCMTLTLGKTFSSKEKDAIDYFVDPIIPKSMNPATLSRNILFLLLNWKDTLMVTSKLYFSHEATIKRVIITAGFIRLYSKVISRQIIKNATYIYHENSTYCKDFYTDEERLKEAERLVKLYSRARFVVTNRIHCALPCLSMGTPVLFTHKADDPLVSFCRFGGLIDLFNVVIFKTNRIKPAFEIEKKIDDNNIPRNKDSWKIYAEQLNQTCIEFVKKK